MEQPIKAGCIVKTRFCKPSSSVFSVYVDYMDRDEATRTEMLSAYNLYNDYMDDPKKTSGLFCKSKTDMSLEEKEQLKETFTYAQENGSLMWQTVISFDNRWLAQNAIYDMHNQILDERKLKEIATGAVNRMLANEGLEHAVWSGAIHYNTDNVHIHIATVEPEPMREMKSYQVYEVDARGAKDNNNKIPVRDANGELVKRMEYIGRFKGKSIEACKRYMVNEILQQREYNLDINKFIRENVIKQKKEHPLSKDADLKEKFLAIYKCLPRSGNRGLWNYNNSVMAEIRPMLDDLSDAYIKKYHQDEYRAFLKTLRHQADTYKEAYGQKSKRDYAEGKIKDLRQRLGNQILKEMKEYDIKTGGEEYKTEDVEKIMENYYAEIGLDYAAETELEISDPITDVTDFPEAEPFLTWSKEYLEARKMLYGADKNIEEGLKMMEKEAQAGNALAIYELGYIYQKGIGVELNQDKASEFYKHALDSFIYLYENLQQKEYKNSKFDMGAYLLYRIGKQYYYGIGVEKDPDEAFKNLKASCDGFDYANYMVGNMYYNGESVEADKAMALSYYEKSIKNRSNAYASYKIGSIYERGDGIEKDLDKASENYKKAYDQFWNMEEENPDANVEYRLGEMNLTGKGVEKDLEQAEYFFRMSADNGNERAQYQYAKLLLDKGDAENTKIAMNMLVRLADKDNVMAQYQIGKLYAEDDRVKDEVKAIKYLSAAAKENVYAQYTLGKLFADKNSTYHDMSRAIECFSDAAERGNSVAMYQLGKIYADKQSEYHDIPQAMHYLSMAAEKGNDVASYALGKLYADKELECYDPVMAIRYLQPVADRGNEYAQYSLGKLFADQEAGVYDPEMAIRYLQPVADKGNEYAQYSAGKLFANQEAGVYDPAKAIHYFQRSSDQGNEYADIALGFMYLNGNGVPVNKVAAHNYFHKAAESGNEFAAKMVDSINDNIQKSYKNRLIHSFVRHKSHYDLERTLRKLSKSFDSELEKAQIIQRHELFLEKEKREIEAKEREEELEENERR